MPLIIIIIIVKLLKSVVTLQSCFGTLSQGPLVVDYLSCHMYRGVARSKYVGWTDVASAEHEPITRVWGPSDPHLHHPPPCKNSSDLYQFQKRPLAKVGLTCPPRGDATAYVYSQLSISVCWPVLPPVTSV